MLKWNEIEKSQDDDIAENLAQLTSNHNWNTLEIFIVK